MWLRDWGLSINISSKDSQSDSLGVLAKVDRVEVEVQILRALLIEGRMLYLVSNHFLVG